LVQLDDWVLCRIYNKKGGLEQPEPAERKPVVSGSYAGPGGAMVSSPPEQKPFVGMTANGGGVPAFPDYAAYYDRPSDSMPRLHADSSCSEQVLSGERGGGGGEVQSQPKISEWERSFATVPDPVNPAACGLGLGGDPLLQDILMYWGKPF
jgi:hypothetical protein